MVFKVWLEVPICGCRCLYRWIIFFPVHKCKSLWNFASWKWNWKWSILKPVEWICSILNLVRNILMVISRHQLTLWQRLYSFWITQERYI